MSRRCPRCASIATASKPAPGSRHCVDCGLRYDVDDGPSRWFLPATVLVDEAETVTPERDREAPDFAQQFVETRKR